MKTTTKTKGRGAKKPKGRVQKKVKKEVEVKKIEISEFDDDKRDSILFRGDFLAKVDIYDDKNEEFLVAGEKKLAVKFSVY